MEASKASSELTETKLKDSPKNPKKPKGLVLGSLVLVVGIAVATAGAVVLASALNRQPTVQDAEYLVEVGAWQRQDEPSVIWKFTEIGKGELTTNAHTNDYDFAWAMEGGKLKIETDWLYNLDDEYAYTLEDGKLILNDKIIFVPAS